MTKSVITVVAGAVTLAGCLAGLVFLAVGDTGDLMRDLASAFMVPLMALLATVIVMGARIMDDRDIAAHRRELQRIRLRAAKVQLAAANAELARMRARVVIHP